MQASDNSLGPYLRSEREQQGIDLHDIASSTKIQPKFIEALEADDYDQLPKGPFVIGFLRSYAECLSLDADEVVAFFQAHHSRQKPMPSPPAQPRQRPALKLPFSIPRVSWQRGVIFSAGLAISLGVLFLVLRSGPSEQQLAPAPSADTVADVRPAARQVISASASPAPALPSPVPLAPSIPDLSSPEPSPATDPIAAEAPQTDAAPPDTPDPALSERPTLDSPPLVLRVQALEETWMRLDIDDGNRQEALIKAGQSREWTASSQFSLTIGNVKGARVSLNDQELDLPSTRSNVLRDYVLTRALLNPRRTD
ncbi:helix-turn-helix domain-containing protein [Candidatus Entotheonella palauensis]|uniref:helix-turn-helix domain-containing protein n=1 Tax=Candidatus Entotheonella palauensis TaxID=93172 RepID=UPI0015C46EF9|nr:RodZ domain-containing protein [Candidatus Entotheonella palauensis]